MRSNSCADETLKRRRGGLGHVPRSSIAGRLRHHTTLRLMEVSGSFLYNLPEYCHSTFCLSKMPSQMRNISAGSVKRIECTRHGDKEANPFDPCSCPWTSPLSEVMYVSDHHRREKQETNRKKKKIGSDGGVLPRTEGTPSNPAFHTQCADSNQPLI
ncbi:uncharacterized protein LY79DRAFT_302378 [Colletotrichum navitas]|uniref:Uncharacterized protein n=1 Tax=Colletotrichum navitas TaxID=681940 RepID=A0AAD8PUJ9_9PEZI|nr:uncharacterized protein LY79DRAFT_302378 [Colletotrichum navitas]KAK1580512.1 hypothetical protein LY79DRAFT_302378 [Colletotrichum navitas]